MAVQPSATPASSTLLRGPTGPTASTSATGSKGWTGVGAPGVVAAIATVVALYLSFGSLAIIRRTTATRVGLLASPWMLALAFGLVAVAVSLIRWTNGSRGAVLSLPALFVALLLVLPWIPLPVPAAFLLWVGPIATLVWAALAAVLFMGLRPAAGAVRPLFVHPVRAPLLAGTLAAALYLFAGWQVSPWLPAGDEPHYLVIAESLLRDGDLRIENNHRARQYLAYVDGELKPDFLRRGVDGEIYSIHAPGLPAALLPAFALSGYPGAVVWLALLSAAGTALAWRLCHAITGHASAAWFGWAVAALPAPILFHAFTIYPDGLGALLVLSGVAALVHAHRLTVPRALLHGAALALLPWVHTRFALLAAALGGAVVLRLLRPPSHPPGPPLPLEGGEGGEMLRGDGAWLVVAAFLAVPLLSAAAWLGSFALIYGTPNPAAPYGTYTQSALRHVPQGLVGLFFDQQFGLIPNAPIFLVALCALGWLVVRPPVGGLSGPLRRLAIELLCVIGPYVVVAAMYAMWWGGWSAPARFLVPLLPMLSLPAAALWAFARTHAARATAMIALGASVWLSTLLLVFERGRLAYNDRDGFALWTDRANPIVDLAYGLPSSFRDQWSGALVRAIIWLAALAAAWLVLRVLERRLRAQVDGDGRRSSTPHQREDPPGPVATQVPAPAPAPALAPALVVAAVAPAVYGIAVMLALTATWRLSGVSGLRPTAAQVAFLRGFAADDGRAPGGVLFGGAAASGGSASETRLSAPRIVGPAGVLERLAIAPETRRLPRERPIFFLPRVPAGRYQLLVEASGGADVDADAGAGADGRRVPEGALGVFVGESGTPIHTFQLGGPSATGSRVAATAVAAPASAGSVRFELALPIGLSSLRIRADDRARRAIGRGRMLLTPLALAPASDAPLPGVLASGAVRYPQGVVFATDRRVYLEPGGFWVQPGAAVDLLIEPDRPKATSVALLVRNGPTANRVRISVEGWHRDLTLGPGEETTIEAPASRRGATPLRVHATAGFRPSALDPANGDHRRLAVWMELR